MRYVTWKLHTCTTLQKGSMGARTTIRYVCKIGMRCRLCLASRLQEKLLELVRAEVVGQQEQEEAALRKAIDQYSDLHSSVIRKEFVRSTLDDSMLIMLMFTLE